MRRPPVPPLVRIGESSYPVLLPSVRDPRLHLAAVVMTLQVLGQTVLGFRISIAQIGVALLTAGALEAAIMLRRDRVIAWPASALLAGSGVAFVLRIPGTEHGDWWSLHGAWIFAATAIAAVLSKYTIRFGGRHLFNPSNFGLVACFLILGEAHAEPLDFWWAPVFPWVAIALAVILVGGILILKRLRLLGVALCFWMAFSAALGVLAASGHSMTAAWHLGPISGWHFWWTLVSSPEVLVFLFFMITDPKTIPEDRAARLVHAALVAVLAVLLIAPQTTEYGEKVALLGALALACALRPLLERLPSAATRAIRYRPARAVAIALPALYVVALFAAGTPARDIARDDLGAPLRGEMNRLPRVTIAPSPGIATPLRRPVALRIARAVIGDLQLETQALRRADARRAARGAAGVRLADLTRQIRAARSGGQLVVSDYRPREIRVGLARVPGQAGPAILATLIGPVVRQTYQGTPPSLVEAEAPRDLRETFVLAPRVGREVIVDSRGGADTADGADARAIRVDLAAPAGTTAPQGRPFAFRMSVTTSAGTSTAATVDLSLVAPGGGGTVPFHQARLLVPEKGREQRRVTVTPAQWYGALGVYEVLPSVGGRRAGPPLRFEVTRPAVNVPRFEDVTDAVGLHTTVPAPACGQFSSGAAWGDVNGDGHLDLFITRLSAPAQLYVRGVGGRFVDRAAVAGVDVTDATGASFADYNNDGHEDLFVARSGRPSLLFDGDGHGHFRDVTREAHIRDTANATSAAWADYNGDGRLDLYVTNYARCTGRWTSGMDAVTDVEYEPDRLYRNDGDGTFTDVTRLLRGRTRGAGFAAAWFDANADNRPDLYLANDAVGPRPDSNRLWRNTGRGAGGWRFADASERSGTGFFMNTMGTGVGDVDRDGRLDLALSNIGGNRLLRNVGNGRFSDIAEAAGVARPYERTGRPSITWGVGLYDFNLDGWEDAYFAAGNVSARRTAGDGPQPNQLFVNDGTGRRFIDLSALSGAADIGDSKGVAFADYNGDGRMDMFVVDQNGSPRLYRNVTPRGGSHWLEVNTNGTVSNRDGCGTRIVARLDDGSSLTSQVLCGSGSVGSGSQKAVHLGLGSGTVRRLDVTWPSGVRQQLRRPALDRMLSITEPKRSEGRP